MFFSEFSLKDFGFEFLNYKVVEKIKMWVGWNVGKSCLF